MADIQNPSNLSDYDWLEFGAFCSKVEREGFTYAADNYSPKFKAKDMQAIADDLSKLRAFYCDNQPKYENWAESTVGWHRAVDLHNAHIDEQRMRSQNHLLWAIHPGGDWNYRPYSNAFESRELAEKYIADSNRRAEEKPENFRRCDWRLLHREVAAGEWTEVPLSV